MNLLFVVSIDFDTGAFCCYFCFYFDWDFYNPTVDYLCLIFYLVSYNFFISLFFFWYTFITSHTIFGLSFISVLYCPTAGVDSLLYLRYRCYRDSFFANQFPLWLFFLFDYCTLSSDAVPFLEPAVCGRLFVALQAWLRAHRENKPKPVGSF